MPGDNTTVHAVSFGLSVDTSKLQEGLAEAKVEIQQAVDEGTSKAADSAYSGFLQSYDQELGSKSYGAVVDLLVAYYGGM